jgi:uncharacterized protein YciI
MPLFVLTCIDRPDGLEARMAAREAHLAYVRESGVVRLAGPFLDENESMAGSMLIIEARDLAAAQAFSAADPYRKAGVFQSVDVRPFRLTIGSL